MRLLIVTPYHAPAYAFGGPVRVIETLAAAAVAAGHEVTIATTDVLDERRRVPAGAPALPPGAEVVRFPNRSHRLAVAAMGWTPRGWLPWIRANAGRFDVVHLNDIYSVLSVGAARAATRAGVPYVLQPHGSASVMAERSKPRIKQAFMALWGRRTIAGAAALFYATAGERADLTGWGARPEQLVESVPPLELDAMRRAAPEPDGIPRVVFVGRLHPIKRVDRLLEATAIARTRVPQLRLEVIGPGDDRPRYEAMADRLGMREAVTFRGMVSEDEKAHALARADVFALLSASEGLPVAAVEAMASGTPVVLSRGCNLPEVEDRAGVVVSGEPQETADAIAALLEDEQRRRRLAEGARDFAARFDADRVTRHALDVLGEKAASAGPRARDFAEGGSLQ